MTDVNIACSLLTDAMDNQFDTALLISGDSDLVPPVKIIRNRWPAKYIIVLFPPGRKSDALRKIVHGQKWIAAADLRQSQLPEELSIAMGKTLRRPDQWR